MKLNFEDREIWESNIITDRAQRADNKNVVIWLIIILTPKVFVFEMSKMT